MPNHIFPRIIHDDVTRFPRYCYGRIFVARQNDITRVERVIKEMSEHEFSYLPDDLIAPISEYPKLICVGKFDALDLNELTVRCFRAGCPIYCYIGGVTEPSNAYGYDTAPDVGES